MDSKILCISLLLAVFCLWAAEASPMEALTMDHSGQAATDETYEKGYPSDDDYRADVHGNKAMVAGSVAKAYANKAKSLEAEGRLLGQLAKDRWYYYKEYTKLAEDARRRGRDYEQQSAAEQSRVGQHTSRQKEWESKAREAETQCKDEDLRAQQMYTEYQELLRNSEVAYAESSLHEANANGYQCKAERMNDWAREMKRRADNLLNDAKNHYTRGKEDENRATAEKVKAHQQAEDAQKHHSASRAYQQEALKVRLASRDNIMRYIQNSLMAEKIRNLAREEEVRAELEEKLANELANEASQASSIAKVLSSEFAFAAARARRDETRAMVYSQTSREIPASMAQGTSTVIEMVKAKDEGADLEGGRRHLAIYPADDSIKAMPSDDKRSLIYADEGM